MTKVVGSIEARMGSSRLRGKTLMPITREHSLLEVVVRRFQAASRVDEVIVATTTSASDDVIENWCNDHGVPVFRGDENDVLDRVSNAVDSIDADIVVQMGADSAYLDYRLIDRLIGIFKTGDYDFVCNTLRLTYPLGIYGHVVSAATLRALNQRTDLSIEDRENVTRPIWANPSAWRIEYVEAPAELAFPQLRFTIDYPEDLALAQWIFAQLGTLYFATEDLIALYRSQPDRFAPTLALVQNSAPHLIAGP